MLQIFADALLIATRMETRPHDHHPPRRPHPADEVATRRRWLSLIGLMR